MRLVLSVGLFLLFLGVACAASWAYGLTPNPTIQWVDLATDPSANNITGPLGDDNDVPLNNAINLQFAFYGTAVPVDHWVLNANGYISFSNLTSTAYSPICPLPQPPTKLLSRGFLFYWSDWCFGCGGGTAFYRFFPVGACPYLAKQSEGCLVVHYDNGYDDDGLFMGNVNAIIFTSGVMLSQVQLFNNSVWGEPSENVGALFGIQDWALNASVMFPNTSCAWAAGGYLNDSFVGPEGGSFSFAIYPPCGAVGNLSGLLRPDGLGCGCNGGYYPVNIDCLPCGVGEISDGLTCSACPPGQVPSVNGTMCVTTSLGTVVTPHVFLLVSVVLILMCSELFFTLIPRAPW